MSSNPQIELARRYIEQTNVSVFLTGKAGTGKTTFLHEVAANCPKRHAIIAPTGVAAINAGGVTIHSFFQLPFDPYLPDIKELVTEYQMPDKYKSLNKNKLNVIRTLELLIIDEISMVRADLLDAIDMSLRRYRRNNRPFGGVQLLMIGDVHQLAPVVTDSERVYMQRVYPSPYFFSSKALQHIPYVTIELTTVYRQQDAAFVDLLNHVRDNRIDTETLQALNSRVSNQAIMQSDNQAIVLTTHNRQADAINRQHMQALHGEQRTFEAIVKGNYPEKSLPCERSLEIKVGERVMFVKNDSSGGHRYYNGKLATVTGFRYDNEEKKEYIVVIDDDGDTILVNREQWESLRYNLDPTSNEIVQEVEGTFCQYPLQAAWAVTIHKAQGLTFDRVIIDAADAFAFGQVYVALSRCRTLEGLTLSSPLSAGVAFSDFAVNHFVSNQPSFGQAAEALTGHEQHYRIEKLMELFGVDDILHLTDRLLEHFSKLKNIYPDQLASLNSQHSNLLSLQNVSERFKSQLLRLDESAQNNRAQQGAQYYRDQLTPLNALLPTLLELDIDNKEIDKYVSDIGSQLSEALAIKLACLEAVIKKGYSVHTVQQAKVQQMMNGTELYSTKNKTNKSAAKKQPAKQTGNETYNTDLATLIRQWRLQKAKEEQLPPYVILQQKALHSISTNMPRTTAELKRQLGVGPKTVERYGKEILDLIADFLSSGQQY